MPINLTGTIPGLTDDFEQAVARLVGFRLIANSPDLSETGKEEVKQAIGDYNRRKNLLDEALLALKELQADGYPALPAQFADQTVIDELKRLASYAVVSANEMQPPLPVSILAGDEKPLG
jgi:hypothetical protein